MFLVMAPFLLCTLEVLHYVFCCKLREVKLFYVDNRRDEWVIFSDGLFSSFLFFIFEGPLTPPAND